MSTLGSAMTPNSTLASAPQQFCLKWGNHSSNLINTFNDLVLNESLTDVTLGCDGVTLKAHKIVLSANSNYFRDLFIATPCKHPIVILKDIKIEDLKAIIDFMYKGEVNISSAQMGNLLKTAETLRVKGLTVANDDKNESEIPSQQPPTSNNSNDVPLVYGETPNGTLGGTSSVNSPSDGQCFNSSSTGQPASPASLKKRKRKRNSGGNIPNSIANNVNNTSSTVTSNNNGLRTNNRVISSVSNAGQISMPLESVTSPHIHTPSTSLVVRNEVDDDLVPASNSDGEMDANSMDFDDDLNRVKRPGRHERDPLVSAAVAQLSNSILPSTSSNMTLVSAANASPIVPLAAESSMSNRGQLRRPTVQQQQSTQQLSQPQQQQQQPSQPTAHTSSIQRDLVSAESSMAGDTVSNDVSHFSPFYSPIFPCSDEIIFLSFSHTHVLGLRIVVSTRKS